jgi:Tfp pilus assembly protein PilW
MAALLIGYFTAIAIVCLFLINRQPHKVVANIAEEG